MGPQVVKSKNGRIRGLAIKPLLQEVKPQFMQLSFASGGEATITAIKHCSQD